MYFTYGFACDAILIMAASQAYPMHQPYFTMNDMEIMKWDKTQEI